MSQLPAQATVASLPGLVTRASQALAAATTAAEVLDLKHGARVQGSAAKAAARLLKAKGAHTEVVVAAHQAIADAHEIEALADMKLAMEHREAQERGEVAGPAGGGERSGRERSPTSATIADLGLTRKLVHEGRRLAHAEEPRALSLGAQQHEMCFSVTVHAHRP